jgi:hypothetical protein
MIVNLLLLTSLVMLSPVRALLSSTTNLSQALCATAEDPATQTKPTAKTEERNTTIWTHSVDGVKIELRMDGKVEFTDDYADIKSVSEDGLFQAVDERGGMTRKLRVMQDVDGRLKRSYWVDGRGREFDAQARAWLREFLLMATREGGLDAEARAQRILQQRGAQGLLDEISLLKTDYARRIYFDWLMKKGNPGHDSLQKALRQAAREIASDYELKMFLVGHTEAFLRDGALVPVFFEATRRIKSDYEHGLVLAAVLENSPGNDALAGLLESARSISSDYEKAKLMIAAAPHYLDDKRLRPAYLELVRTISSDYERGRVLTFVSKRTPLN